MLRNKLFIPVWWLRNSHVQTIVANFTRPEDNISFRRQRLTTPDGDFIDIDFADVPGRTWADLGAKAPVALVLHGLEGSARRGYACELYRLFSARGYRPVGMNYRGCSGELNHLARAYHAGATDDVDLVFQELEKQFPHVPKLLLGISLGGNMTLKYVGERGKNISPNLQAAAAISPPMNMNIGSKALKQGLGFWYGYRILRCLQEKMRQKSHLLTGQIDLDRALKARTIPEFDEYSTAPLHGFQNAEDYYSQCSSARFLPEVAIPTLIIRSVDDPMIDPADIPYPVFAQNPHLHPLITPYGGHVGFVDKRPGGYHFWAEEQAADFVTRQVGV